MMYVAIVFVILIGTLLHFTYELSHHNKFVAIFSAVNESTWEHIKICMTPTILFSLYDGFYYGMSGNYLIAKSMCLLTIILLIPILFYTYTVFTKKSILIIDIICFCITAICSEKVFYYIVNLEMLPYIYTYLASILLFIEIGCYMYLTFNPLINFIFKDPITHKYGLEGHPCEHHHHNHKEEK